MKELHLICNAHLDPVWQWDWNEGAAAALATFYSAAELADEYDYIFCHNEALLYEWIERYDPALFSRIKELVAAGKWHIMGGWYCQPDCTVPSGEGFVRQIETGLTYFKEKFGVRPTTAVNFDSFGHTQGLVQILNKTGYDSYIFCRPLKPMMELPHMFFEWKGLDGVSSVKAARFEDDTIYCSELGNAVNAIKRKMRPWQDEDVAFALWGIGNHGGGPSRKDLFEIGQMIKEELGNGVRIMHSTPEQFFAAATPTATVDDALEPCFVKCYSSVSTLKRRYASLEDALLMTEKICARAAIETDFEYDKAAMDEAQRIMAMVQFHDVLSGTSILEGNVSALRKADYALEILDEQFSRAFFKLYEGWTRGAGGEFPFAVFNPHPYEIDGVFDLEMLIMDAMDARDPKMYALEVRDEHGVCVSQLTKESSTINMDRRKRVTVRAKLKPMSLSRFDVKITKVDRVPVDKTPQTHFEIGNQKIDFCPECGCLASLEVDGKQYRGGGAFAPVVFTDNADPWGWWLKTISNEQKALDCKTSLRVIERGDVLTRLESEYTTGKSDVRVGYTVYNDLPYVDIKVNVSWNDAGKGLKLEIPLAEVGKFIGQTSFGTQEYCHDLEQCSHRFVAVENGDKVLGVFKQGTYGCSIENGKLYLTLLNGSVYCAHPAGDLPILPDERYYDYIDLGVHEYSFRLEVCDKSELERKATEFAQKFYTLNVYPHGKGVSYDASPVTLSDNNITLSAFRKMDADTYMIRLFNNLDAARACTCTVMGTALELEFGKYEVKTLLYQNGNLCEHDSMLML